MVLRFHLSFLYMIMFTSLFLLISLSNSLPHFTWFSKKNIPPHSNCFFSVFSENFAHWPLSVFWKTKNLFDCCLICLLFTLQIQSILLTSALQRCRWSNPLPPRSLDSDRVTTELGTRARSSWTSRWKLGAVKFWRVRWENLGALKL